MTLLFALLAFLAGAGLALQAGANAQLSKAIGNPFVATAIQLAIAAVLLLAGAILWGAAPALARLGSAPRWHMTGGVASAIYVLATILIVPRLGAVVTVGLFIAGQTFASLLLDGFGLLGLPSRSWPVASVAGGLAVLLGVMALVVGQSGRISVLRERPGLVSLALVAGAGLPVQGAINALLRADIGAPLAVGFTSFIVATFSMLAFLPIAKRFLGAHAPDFRGLEAMPRWGWLGGLAGAFYVTTVFTTLPVIGAASVVALTVAGQQAASVLVDRFGLLGFATRPISVQRLAGVALLFVGVLLVQIA